MNEAQARVHIDRMLESAGWRLFDADGSRANVQFEVGVPLTRQRIEGLGDDYQRSNGKADYLLLDGDSKPLAVLEAKSTGVDILSAKEQAREYADSLGCHLVILSNGLQSYFWDLRRGNPTPISVFPTPESITDRVERELGDPTRLVNEDVGDDYIVLSIEPGYQGSVWWTHDAERDEYIRNHKLPFMRDYQVAAVHAIQQAVDKGDSRFLIEMATGTGKTLAAAAIIRLFLNTRNARRVLFLVDRIELENQADKALKAYLGNDRTISIYKRNPANWHHADVVITTVQSLLVNNRYRDLFSPTDFDLVISDEAHRSISGSSRAVFEYFIGYKLGLTATPRDYLRGFDASDSPIADPRELERRELRDTYRTFGCPSSNPTYRYGLLDGAKDGHLVNPTTVDARTEVTTELLSKQGLHIEYRDSENELKTGDFHITNFERDFFSDATNRLFCRTFLKEGMRDPISKEFGKSIIYTVSQRHAQAITGILNELAHEIWPGRFQSDFAVQVTSMVKGAQDFAQQFANNNLRGNGNVLQEYRSSKTRVCVTVGMMTTGYDCPDLLNIGLFRPIFSATEFVQIKGRGTRRHRFADQAISQWLKDAHAHHEKTTFKLIDFFGNFEYFDKEHDYDKKLELPTQGTRESEGYDSADALRQWTWRDDDHLTGVDRAVVGPEGMKVDRMLFDRFKDDLSKDPIVAEAAEDDDWERVADQVRTNIFGQPEDYFNLPKLRMSLGLDDDVPLREILEFALGKIDTVKTRDERAAEAFDLFAIESPPIPSHETHAVRTMFLAYATNASVREAIDSMDLTSLETNPAFTMHDLEQVPDTFRRLVPDWINANFTRKD